MKGTAKGMVSYMLDGFHKLDLSAKELELIEAALHTQKKILSVQSQAGGSVAREKLGDLKQLMKRIRRERPQFSSSKSTWLHSFRAYFTSSECCNQVR
jgi:hypothetical protein